jgi:PAS domain S-box-containing protein
MRFDLHKMRPSLPVACLAAAGAAEVAGMALDFRGSGIVALGALALAGAASLRAGAWARRALGAATVEQAELRALAARRGEIIDGAGEAIIVIDDRATIAAFNRAAERMFGFTAAEMIGTRLERLMTDGARKHHQAHLAKTGVTAMVEAARTRTIHKGVRKRGEVFTFELTMTEWSDGGRRMFTGILRDVTDRERVAEALREANSRFTTLFEASGEALFVYALGGDGGFVLESMNRVAEGRTGLSRYAVAGLTPEKISGPETGRALQRALLECMSTGETTTSQFNLLCEAGREMAPLTLIPMREPTGEVRRVLVVRGAAVAPAAAGAAAAA